ncbi:uncharacterized protein LOC122370286 isoform X3 [Amphibalanus amphitrite]|uniref:uncharacterized protein LOC122370286 isoform X3 n=1 Tax=Amphibalanus amphitrite TaxID=1232801 RepID=UPI001C918079|nr:uncharacterized protein LOC122370286 isoform X3 [Amphibalanus amphitrite]
MWLLLGCLLAAAAPALGRDCEKMKVPFCSNMPYDELRLPNLYGHTTQEEVNRALEPLQQMQTSGCFGHYSFLLCTALAPPCMADVERPAPCRRVCERARDRCYGLLLMYNVTEAWPDCDLLPKNSADPLCMMPTSLTPRDNCHCLKKHQPEKPTLELMNDRDYGYSIKARMDGFAPSHFPSILSVTVLDIFRDGIVQMNIGNTSFIVTNTSCKCPELEAGKEYLIMGHEDLNRTELLLGKDSYVVPWSDPVQRNYGAPAREAYQDPDRRTYSRHYHSYCNHHGYSLGFHRPSATNLLMAGGAYALYRHYKNKKKLGKVYGYPGYGGYGSSFGALGGGGYGALGNPRGKFTNFNTFGAPAAGAAAFGAAGYGYNNYNNYNRFGQTGSQVPSYPITHKPNFATNKPSFTNKNLNPSYPVTSKPSYPVTSKPYRTSSSNTRSRTSRWRTSRTSSSRSWGSRSRSSRGGWGGRSTQSNNRYTQWSPPRTTARPSYPATRRPVYPATRSPSRSSRWSSPSVQQSNNRNTQRTTPRTTARPTYPATRRPTYPATRRPVYPATRQPYRASRQPYRSSRQPYRTSRSWSTSRSGSRSSSRSGSRSSSRSGSRFGGSRGRFG